MLRIDMALQFILSSVFIYSTVVAGEKKMEYYSNPEMDLIQTKDLHPKLLEYYEAVMPLLKKIDKEFPPKEGSFAPGSVIPLLEGDGRTGLLRNEVKYINNQWQHVTYEERSNNVYKLEKFIILDDLVYMTVKRFTGGRAYSFIKEQLDRPEDIDFRKLEHDLQLKMMEYIKPEWSLRLKKEISEEIKKFPYDTAEELEEMRQWIANKKQ